VTIAETVAEQVSAMSDRDIDLKMEQFEEIKFARRRAGLPSGLHGILDQLLNALVAEKETRRLDQVDLSAPD
jgi:ABC-type phosphate transport system auxiliary subunit